MCLCSPVFPWCLQDFWTCHRGDAGGSCAWQCHFCSNIFFCTGGRLLQLKRIATVLQKRFWEKFADMTFIYWLWVCSNGIHLVILGSAAIPGGSLAVPTCTLTSDHIFFVEWSNVGITTYEYSELMPTFMKWYPISLALQTLTLGMKKGLEFRGSN